MYTSVAKTLKEHYEKVGKNLVMKELFETQPERAERFSLRFGNFYVDYSKHLIDETTFNLLLDLARAAKVQEKARKMFRGDRINFTEDRAVLHTALR